MRTLGFGLVLLGAALGLSFGCGESEEGAGKTDGGSSGSGGATTGGSDNASAGTAASQAGASATAGSASGGSASGGSSNGGGGGATTGGQPETQAGAGNEAGTGAGLVDCDPKKILCKRLAPECGAGEVPSVDGNCYGDCVKVDHCACSAAAQCPQPEQYTCWAKQHCGPFVE